MKIMNKALFLLKIFISPKDEYEVLKNMTKLY
jgi:hypothetical protein